MKLEYSLYEASLLFIAKYFLAGDNNLLDLDHVAGLALVQVLDYFLLSLPSPLFLVFGVLILEWGFPTLWSMGSVPILRTIRPIPHSMIDGISADFTDNSSVKSALYSML